MVSSHVSTDRMSDRIELPEHVSGDEAVPNKFHEKKSSYDYEHRTERIFLRMMCKNMSPKS